VGTEFILLWLTGAIRDEKVLKFKVDYNDVRAKNLKILRVRAMEKT